MRPIIKTESNSLTVETMNSTQPERNAELFVHSLVIGYIDWENTSYRNSSLKQKKEEDERKKRRRRRRRKKRSCGNEKPKQQTSVLLLLLSQPVHDGKLCLYNVFTSTSDYRLHYSILKKKTDLALLSSALLYVKIIC